MTRNTRPRPEGYEPLALAPDEVKARFKKTADLAHQQPLKAIKLKCLDCSSWDYAEAKRCEIKTCALWASNRRVFLSGSDDGSEGS